jgi:hypothetical protein
VARIRVNYSDGGVAKNAKISVSVDGGGMADGFTGNDGWAFIDTSGTRGKVYVNGKEVHHGDLNNAHVIYPR